MPYLPLQTARTAWNPEIMHKLDESCEEGRGARYQGEGIRYWYYCIRKEAGKYGGERDERCL